MNETTTTPQVLADRRDADTEALNELAAALGQVLEQGLARFPEATRAPLVAQLRRLVATGGSFEYSIRAAPGHALGLRCYLNTGSAGDAPMLLFEVEAGSALMPRLLN